MATKKGQLPKSPIKMSTEKYRDRLDKNAKGRSMKDMEPARKKTTKELGYSEGEAAARAAKAEARSPRGKAIRAGMSARTAHVPPKEVQRPSKTKNTKSPPRR